MKKLLKNMHGSDNIKKFIHSLLNNIENHVNYVKSLLVTLDGLHLEIVRGLKEHSVVSHLLAKFESILNEVYVFNLVNLECCRKILKKTKKFEHVDFHYVYFHFRRRIHYELNSNVYMKLLNEYYMLLSKNDLPKSEQIERTLMIPNRYFYEFLVDLSKVFNLKTFVDFNTLPDRLAKNDWSIKKHKIGNNIIAMYDSNHKTYYKYDDNTNDSDIYTSDKWDSAFSQITWDTASEYKKLSIVSYEQVATFDHSIEIMNELKCFHENIDFGNVKGYVRDLRIMTLEYSIVNIKGNFNREQSSIIRKWMSFKETSKHELFSTNYLLIALDKESKNDLAGELAFYRRIKEYVKKFKEISNTGKNPELNDKDRMSCTTMFSKKPEQPNFETLEIEQNYDIVTQPWWAPLASWVRSDPTVVYGKVDPKTHFANERTFLQYFGVAFSLFSLGFTLFSLDQSFFWLFICYATISFIIIVNSLVRYSIRLNNIKKLLFDVDNSDSFGPILVYGLTVGVLCMFLYNASSANRLTLVKLPEYASPNFKSNLFYKDSGFYNFNDVYVNADSKVFVLTYRSIIKLSVTGSRTSELYLGPYGDFTTMAWNKDETYVVLAGKGMQNLYFYDYVNEAMHDMGYPVEAEAMTMVNEDGKKNTFTLYYTTSETIKMERHELYNKSLLKSIEVSYTVTDNSTYDSSTTPPTLLTPDYKYKFTVTPTLVLSLNDFVGKNNLEIGEMYYEWGTNKLFLLDRANSMYYVMDMNNGLKNTATSYALGSDLVGLNGIFVGYINQNGTSTRNLFLTVDYPPQV